MKKYFGFSLLILLELFMFYIFPMFAGETDAIGMVFIIIFATFVLSFIAGLLKNKLKYTYPFIISIIFIPSVFIYYNESALVHSLWYLVVSIVGLGFGSLAKLLINKFSKLYICK